MSSVTPFQLQQQAELRDFIHSNSCIICSHSQHTISSCDSMDVIEFEIKLLQKILSLRTHPHRSDLLWLYLKNSHYYMLATFAHTRLHMPLETTDTGEDEDNYISYIWSSYSELFRYNPHNNERAYNILTERLRICMDSHPDYEIQRLVYQDSRNGNGADNEDEDEDEDEYIPGNVIEYVGEGEEESQDWLGGELMEVESQDWLGGEHTEVGRSTQIEQRESMEEQNWFDIDLLNGEAELDDIPLSIDCPICLEEIPQMNIVKLQCNHAHLYCSSCIVNVCHENPKCSLCRVPIQTITIYSDETMDELAPYLVN